jgi:hypothetical protein
MVAKTFCLLAQGNAHITSDKKVNAQICTSPAARVRVFFLRGGHGDSSEGVTTY